MRRVVALLLVAASARADSRAPSEAAPLVELRPLDGDDLSVAPIDTTIALDETRREAEATARFRLRGAPGPHDLFVLGPPTLPGDDAGPCPVDHPDPVGIDPSSGTRYRLAPVDPAPCSRKRLSVELPPSGTTEITLRAILLPGYDRLRRRRTYPEVAHLSTKRADYFVYHYAVRGPAGDLHLVAPPRTDARLALDGDVVRLAATEHKRLPFGATIAVGIALPPGDHGDVKLAGRATLDALLPWGDQIALGVDADHSLRTSVSIGYQLFTRWIAFFPVGAHLETSAVVDVYPTARAGLRVGVGGHFAWVSTQVLVDVLPSSAADRSVDVRVISVTGIGL